MRFMGRDQLISAKGDMSWFSPINLIMEINFPSHGSGDMTFTRCVTCANAVLSFDRNSPLYMIKYFCLALHPTLCINL